MLLSDSSVETVVKCNCEPVETSETPHRLSQVSQLSQRDSEPVVKLLSVVKS